MLRKFYNFFLTEQNWRWRWQTAAVIIRPRTNARMCRAK